MGEDMEKRLAATEVRVRFGEILKKVAQGERVVVERSGVPMAVILSIEEFQKLKSQNKRVSRKDQLQRIKKLREGLRGTVPDIVELMVQARKEREDAVLDSLR